MLIFDIGGKALKSDARCQTLRATYLLALEEEAKMAKDQPLRIQSAKNGFVNR